jgi:hypothetical protein
MKYMLLVYSAEDAWTEDERATCMADSAELCHQLNAQGQYLGASPLHPVALATSVQIRDGKQLITNGPFAETTEQLGGYYLIEVDHLDAAIAIASAIPAAEKGTIEVRPIFELTNLPEQTHRETT